MPLVKVMLMWAIRLMMLAIFGSVIISWLRAMRLRVPYHHPLIRAIDDTADVMLRPIRRSLSTTAGGLDFSPVVALLILSILQTIIARL